MAELRSRLIEMVQMSIERKNAPSGAADEPRWVHMEAMSFLDVPNTELWVGEQLRETCDTPETANYKMRQIVEVVLP
ncbi:hypothetical protein OSTOST_06802 [Ostertagia ostertagi]